MVRLVRYGVGPFQVYVEKGEEWEFGKVSV